MSYVIYIAQQDPNDRTPVLKTTKIRPRKAIVDKFVERYGALVRVTSKQDFDENVVKMIKVINMMSNKECEISSDTPNCCDPSSEAYWSM